MPALTAEVGEKRAAMAPATRATIESLLINHAPIDVQGWARQKHGLIITYADTLEVYREIATSTLGRRKVRPGGVNARMMPADFPIHAVVERNPELMKRYSAKVGAISRWRRESGVKPPEHRHLQPRRKGVVIPDGFADVAPTMTFNALRLHYGVGQHTLQRWLHEGGVNCKRVKPGRKPQLPTPMHTQRDMTRAGQAADYLRRDGPLIRCNGKGAYSQTGDHWVRGSTLLSADDVIERAIRRGWNPDAWQELAA